MPSPVPDPLHPARKKPNTSVKTSIPHLAFFVTFNTLLKIADALEVNPQDFFLEFIKSDTKEQIKDKIQKMLELL